MLRKKSPASQTYLFKRHVTNTSFIETSQANDNKKQVNGWVVTRMRKKILMQPETFPQPIK